MNAISSDVFGRAHIDTDKCVSCGMCMVSCPFGAISDKSQIFQLIRCLKEGGEVVAKNRAGICLDSLTVHESEKYISSITGAGIPRCMK